MHGLGSGFHYLIPQKVVLLLVVSVPQTNVYFMRYVQLTVFL